MSIEKQDNWRQKLLDIDHLPGDMAYDRETAWQQLQSRLQPVPRRKKRHWYSAAAAVVILLGWPLLTKKTAMPPVAKNMAAMPVNSAVSPVPPIKKEAASLIIVSGAVGKKIIPQETSGYNKRGIGTIKHTALPVLIDSNQAPAPEALSVLADSTTLATVAAKPQNKLPVVHINELETVPPQLALSTDPAHGRWKIKRFHRSAANQLLAAQKGNDGIINIKLSSKN